MPRGSGCSGNAVKNPEIGAWWRDVLELRLLCEALGLTMEEFIMRLEAVSLTQR